MRKLIGLLFVLFVLSSCNPNQMALWRKQRDTGWQQGGVKREITVYNTISGGMDNSGSAFPPEHLNLVASQATRLVLGLSKRELFAALAMAEFCAHRGDTTLAPQFIGELSRECDDALLAALKEKEA